MAKKKKKKKLARNWHAVNAHQRTSAGAMKNKRDKRKSNKDWRKEVEEE